MMQHIDYIYSIIYDVSIDRCQFLICFSLMHGGVSGRKQICFGYLHTAQTVGLELGRKRGPTTFQKKCGDSCFKRSKKYGSSMDKKPSLYESFETMKMECVYGQIICPFVSELLAGHFIENCSPNVPGMPDLSLAQTF